MNRTGSTEREHPEGVLFHRFGSVRFKYYIIKLKYVVELTN